MPELVEAGPPAAAAMAAFKVDQTPSASSVTWRSDKSSARVRPEMDKTVTPSIKRAALTHTHTRRLQEATARGSTAKMMDKGLEALIEAKKAAAKTKSAYAYRMTSPLTVLLQTHGEFALARMLLTHRACMHLTPYVSPSHIYLPGTFWPLVIYRYEVYVYPGVHLACVLYSA